MSSHRTDTGTTPQPSGELNITPILGEPALPPRPEPLNIFREQVISTWLPKLNDPDHDAAEIFLEAEAEKLVKFTTYTPAQLHALDKLDRLAWKEAFHYEDVLSQISFPVDVDRTFHGRGEGPILFVREASAACERVVVVNGNHRTGAAMREDLNPGGHSIYVVEFADSDVYAKIMDCRLSLPSYIDIDTLPGGRPR
jgi:hypothetical protein